MMRMKWIGRALGALGLVAAQGCAAAAEAESPRPALWRLADEDTTIYLFGTIHLLPAGHQWRTPALEQAMAASDELVLEAVIDPDLAKQAKAVAALGLARTPMPPLVERVPEEKRAVLAERLAALGVPAGALDRYETWAAGLTLLAASFQQLGLKAEAGVERGLADTYRSRAKTVTGLETVEQQFGFLDGLSEEGQRTFLLGVLDDPKEARAQFDAMLRAWTRGDVAAIAETFDSETMLSDELRAALMTRRNASWAGWLEQRLEQPGTVMVAVGAGHLAGADSLQAMLGKRGLSVERVQ